MMQRPDTDAVQVAIHADTALVRVAGRGSFKNGSTLKQFALSAMKQGCTRFLLDMDECVGMDSTFMGVLAGLALKLRREPATQDSGRVVMMNLSAKTDSLLKTLGLDQLLELHLVGDTDEELRDHLAAVTSLSSLEAGEDQKITLSTILEAHQDLVKADPENLPKFKSVIEYVSQDLNRFGRS